MSRPGSSGSALIAALWVVLLVSLLIATVAFDLHVETDVLSYYRKRVKAQYAAQSGMELAKLIMLKMEQATEDEVGIDDSEEQMLTAAWNLKRGVAIRGMTRQIGEATLRLDVVPEEGRRNVNQLTDEDWEEILDQANVPQERWAEIIDCFMDWTDEDDLRRLHGAEADDPFYVQRGYEPKNAPVDTVDELLLIKSFDEELLFGSPSGTPPEEAIRGIGYWLTAWSHGRVNINTASREVLLTLPGLEDWAVDAILEQRLGPDGLAGTRDDGFDSVEQAIALTGMTQALRDRLTVTDVHYLRVTSIGEMDGVMAAVWAVMRVDGNRLVPVYWREEPL